MNTPPKYHTRQTLSAELNVSISHLKRCEKDGTLTYTDLGARTKRYSPEDLSAFLNKSAREPLKGDLSVEKAALTCRPPFSSADPNPMQNFSLSEALAHGTDEAVANGRNHLIEMAVG